MQARELATLGSLGHQIVVNGRLEVAQRTDRGIVVERQVLHQQYAADATVGIDPEFSVEKAGPAETAGATILRGIGAGAGDLEAETELVPAGSQGKWLG